MLGDRESFGDQEIDRQRHQLGAVVATQTSLPTVAPERRPRDERGHAGLMHVKAAVVDSRVAFLTSANLTEAALERNMELGVLIRGGTLPASIDRLIDALVESGELQGGVGPPGHPRLRACMCRRHSLKVHEGGVRVGVGHSLLAIGLCRLHEYKAALFQCLKRCGHMPLKICGLILDELPDLDRSDVASTAKSRGYG